MSLKKLLTKFVAINFFYFLKWFQHYFFHLKKEDKKFEFWHDNLLKKPPDPNYFHSYILTQVKSHCMFHLS